MPAIAFQTAAFNPATKSAAYSAQIATTGGFGGALTFTLFRGSLPPNVALSADGLLAGTPSAAGLYVFEVKLVESGGGIVYRTFTLLVKNSASSVFTVAASHAVFRSGSPAAETNSLLVQGDILGFHLEAYNAAGALSFSDNGAGGQFFAESAGKTRYVPANETKIITFTVSDSATTKTVSLTVYATNPLNAQWGGESAIDRETKTQQAKGGTDYMREEDSTRRTEQLDFLNRETYELEALRSFWLFHRKVKKFYQLDMDTGEIALVKFASELRWKKTGGDSFNIFANVRGKFTGAKIDLTGYRRDVYGGNYAPAPNGGFIVSLLSPSAGTTVTGAFTFSANIARAGSTAQVSEVQYFAGNFLLGKSFNAASQFEFSFDSAELGNAIYAFTAVAVTDETQPKRYSSNPVVAQVSNNSSVIAPAPPILTANDTANTLSASSPFGDSEIELAGNNGTYVPYTAPVNIGDIYLAYGFYKFRVRAATGRPVGLVAYSPEFTPAQTTTPPPTKPPVASFTKLPVSGNAPLAVNFTDTSTGGATAWAWDFGDGATSKVQNPSHTFAAAGSYTAKLVVSNSGGSSTSALQTITVSTAPPAQPPAPTNPKNFTNPNAFGFTEATNYPSLTDYEYSVSSGAAGTFASFATNPIGLGSAAYAPGQIVVRVKAAAGRNVGYPLSNNVAFTASGGGTPTNYALSSNGSSATASSSYSGSNPNSALDGNRSGASPSSVAHSAANDVSITNPFVLTVDFGQNRTITEIDVIGYDGDNQTGITETRTYSSAFALQDFEVFVRDSGDTAWLSVGSVTNNNLVWKKFTFAAKTTRKIQLAVTKTGDSYARVNELEAVGGAATGGDTTAPTVGAMNTPTAASSSGIDLSWSAANDNVGVTGYEITRSLSNAFTTPTIIKLGNVVAYSDTGLGADTTYYYKLRAFDAAGNYSPYSNTVSTKTGAAAGSTGGTSSGNGSPPVSGGSEMTDSSGREMIF